MSDKVLMYTMEVKAQIELGRLLEIVTKKPESQCRRLKKWDSCPKQPKEHVCKDCCGWF